MPHTFTVGPGGEIYLADQSADRILVFRGDGSLLREIGHHGAGPGEFQRIGPITIPHDSVILQEFLGNTLAVLNASDGQELHRWRHAGYIASWAVTPQYLLLGDYDRVARKMLLVISWDSLARTKAGARLEPQWIQEPAEYREYPGLELFNQAIVSGHGDTALVGFGATNFLVRMDLKSMKLDTLEVPVRARRGVPKSRLQRYRNPALPFYDGLSGISNLLGIWRFSGGAVALWYQEGATEDRNRPNAEIIGYGYITVLDPRLERACADGLVRAPGTSRVRLGFSRDTLYSFDQTVDPNNRSAPRVRSLIRKYVVDLKACDWLPVAAGRRP